MTTLVTGGAGFIGSHLCDRLIALGNQVVCVDNFITGKKANIQHLKNHPQFKFIKRDCIGKLSRFPTCQQIYHLASPASPVAYQKYPLPTLLVNSYGTYQLLELARQWKAKFIFASTSEVYGDPLQHPQKETYWGNVNSLGPRACYDESKRLGETLTSIYTHTYQLDTRIVRIFNTYGPRMDLNDGRVITNFIKQILSHKPLTINGTGNQTRSFCYISDLIDGLIKIANHPEAYGQVFNLGNPEEIRISGLAYKLMDIARFKGKIVYQDLPTDDPVRRRPDISKIKQFTGWQPRVSLKDGLNKTFTYYSTRH